MQTSWRGPCYDTPAEVEDLTSLYMLEEYFEDIESDHGVRVNFVHYNSGSRL